MTSLDASFYPTFRFIEQKGEFFPEIRLPQNYYELVRKFYEQDRAHEVKEFAKTVQKEYLQSNFETGFIWDKNKGLTTINVGVGVGLDLNRREPPSFQEHNLGPRTAVAAGLIAMKYISELLKSE